jgi:RNA polymerase primary sigma factor
MELRRKKNTNSEGKNSKASWREGDTVGWYLDKIKDHEILPHERVVELFKRVESGDKTATNELVKRNLKLVVAVARAYRDKGVDWEDLLQEGNMGLIHAIEKFEWKRGHRFSTYATWWIRQRISHFLSTQRHSIRVPTHAMRLKKHIENTLEQFRRDGIEDPSWDKVADVVGSSADVVEATIAGSKATISLSQPSSSSSESSARSESVEHSGDDPETMMSSLQLKEVIQKAVEILDPVDKLLVQLRVGLTK